MDSWRLGAVRMTERFLGDGEPASRRRSTSCARTWPASSSGAEWLGAGRRGSSRSAARRARWRPPAQRAAGLPRSACRASYWSRRARRPDRAARRAARRRARVGARDQAGPGDIVLAGAVVIRGVMEAAGVDGMEVTEAGLREGVFFETSSPPTSPPLFDDVRLASVTNLAARFPVDGGTSSTWGDWRWGCSTSSPRQGCMTATRSSASCCGRRACSTTSAWRWTTTTTTSTRAI